MSMPTPRIRAGSLLTLAVLTLAVAACSDRAQPSELSTPRESSTPAAAIEQPRSSAERLGVQSPSSSPPAAAPNATNASNGAPTSGGNGALKWELPAGWSELAPTSMRVANFRVAGDERAECYLTFLAGDGGGLAANIQRWRTQMGQGPLSPQDIAALPTKPMLGGDAVLVDFAGSFSGMGGGGKIEDARLVGLLLVGPQGAAFLKMTGPASTLAGQVDAFLALAASLRN